MHVHPFARLLIVASCLLAPGCAALSEEETKALDMYTSTAEGYYRLGDHDRAIGQALKGLAIDRDDEKLKLILGWSLQRRGKTEDVQRAEQVFRELSDGDDFRARLGLAQSLERQGIAHLEAAEAVESGRRVTEAADPKARVSELRTRAVDLCRESIEWYERTLAVQKANLDALNGLVRVEALLGRREESLSWAAQLLAALATDRAFWDSRLQTVDASQIQEDQLRDLARQIADLEVATRLHSATLTADLGRWQESASHLDAAIELAPDRADLHGLRGLARKELGRYGEAIADFERFLALTQLPFDDPNIQRAWQALRECEAARTAAR